MSDAIGNLLTAAPHTEEWLVASRLTFDLSTADEKKAASLYKAVEAQFAAHVSSLASALGAEPTLLAAYQKEWLAFLATLERVSLLLQPLDRNYAAVHGRRGVAPVSAVHDVKTTGLLHWRRHLVQPLSTRLHDELLRAFDAAREDEGGDLEFLRAVLEGLQTLGGDRAAAPPRLRPFAGRREGSTSAGGMWDAQSDRGTGLWDGAGRDASRRRPQPWESAASSSDDSDDSDDDDDEGGADSPPSSASSSSLYAAFERAMVRRTREYYTARAASTARPRRAAYLDWVLRVLDTEAAVASPPPTAASRRCVHRWCAARSSAPTARRSRPRSSRSSAPTTTPPSANCTNGCAACPTASRTSRACCAATSSPPPPTPSAPSRRRAATAARRTSRRSSPPPSRSTTASRR